MKMRDAAEVTLSILGVSRIVQSAIETPNLAYALYLRSGYTGQAASFTTAPILLRNFGGFAANLVVGILLVLLAGRLADWLVRRSVSLAGTDVDFRIVSPEGFRFCLKLVGITLLVSGVETLMQWSWPRVIAGALTLALAVYLIRGGGWLTRFAWGKAGA
jgi:hypothetical protein